MLIKNMWKNTTFFCEEDGTELELMQINNYVFYRCPKCHVQLGTGAAERCIDKLCELETERQHKSLEVNYTGKQFASGKFSYIVKNEGEGEWQISVKALR